MDKLLRNGRGMLLAYDQGLEHGPSDFDDRNVDPEYILTIAKDAQVFTGIIFQKGIAERYYPTKKLLISSSESLLPPLIVKLNGKTSFHEGEEPFAPLLCTVGEAITLGASAVGYTVYIGSEREGKMLETFSAVVRECNQRGIPTIGWMYLAGKHISDPHDRGMLSYAARVGLEVGADAVKLQFAPGEDEHQDVDDLERIKANAGRCRVFISGGKKMSDENVLQLARSVIAAGITGLAIGRNIWQREDPVEFSKKIAEIIFS